MACSGDGEERDGRGRGARRRRKGAPRLPNGNDAGRGGGGCYFQRFCKKTLYFIK
jgi:hypothetical protein